MWFCIAQWTKLYTNAARVRDPFPLRLPALKIDVPILL